MKLENTTDYPDYFLRRMISWVRKEIGLPASQLLKVTVNHTRGGRRWSGMAWRYEVRLSIIKPNLAWVPRLDTREGHKITLQTCNEALVLLAAHELEHILQHYDGRMDKLRKRRSLEHVTRNAARQVLEDYRNRKDELEREWSEKPARLAAAECAPSVSLVERRAAHAAKKLCEWEKKETTAKKRIAHWRKKVKYYNSKTEDR